MPDEAPPKLEDVLADPRLVAVCNAFVRSQWDPPLYQTLSERLDAVARHDGWREAELQAWPIVVVARQFLAMYDAAVAFPHPRGGQLADQDAGLIEQIRHHEGQ